MTSKISVIIEDELKSQLIDDSALYGKSLSQFFIECYKFYQTNKKLFTLPKISKDQRKLRKKVYKSRSEFTKNLSNKIKKTELSDCAISDTTFFATGVLKICTNRAS